MQRGITAGADKTVVFLGSLFFVHRNVRTHTSDTGLGAANGQMRGRRPTTNLTLCSGTLIRARQTVPSLSQGPASAGPCDSAEWGPQQMCKLVTVRRFKRDELTLPQHTSQFVRSV